MYKVSRGKFSASVKTVEAIAKRVDSNGIKTITMGFPDIYGRLIGKKYDPDYFLDGIISKGSNACNYLLGCDIMFTPLPNAKLSSFDLGYGDYMMKADLQSTRDINYVNGQNQLLLFSDLYYIEKDSKPVEYAPRYLLKKALKGLDDLEVKLKVECEINFTAFHEKYRKAMNDIRNMNPITEHNNFANVFYSQSNEKLLSSLSSSMLYSGIPVSSIFGDSGKGQFKVVLDASDPVEFSDNITLMKLVSLI